ncbi:MAG: hypothetical protein ACI9FB_002062 [Candidatus Azotimanducaceae bacterium]
MCSDIAEHETRYIARIPDNDGLEYGPWDDVLNRVYEECTSMNLLINTASNLIDKSKSELLALVQQFNNA